MPASRKSPEANPRDVQYEVSLCDLLDSNMDILLDYHTNQLHWRQDKTTAVEYLFGPSPRGSDLRLRSGSLQASCL